MPPDRDHVDDLIDQWRAERPDLGDALPAMATFGRLGRLHAHATASIGKVFAEHGLNIGEFDVLAALRRAGEPYELRPTQLANLLMLSPGGMTNRLDRLEASGTVERRSDPADRRSWIIALTAKGKDVVDEAVSDHVANEAALLDVLSASDRAALDKALRRLLTQFDHPDAGTRAG
jgi:DNA-binding MarR family transcriptional regulator